MLRSRTRQHTEGDSHERRHPRERTHRDRGPDRSHRTGGRRGGCARSALGRRPGHLHDRDGRAAGPGEGPHPGRRRDRRSATPPTRGGGRCEPAARRSRRAPDPARRVRGAPAAHRVLLHVADRSPGGGAVRGLHLLHRAGPRALPGALPRRHIRRPLPGAVRAERPLSRLHGLGRAVVLGAALPRLPPRRAPDRPVPPGLLPAGRQPGLRDLLDEGPGCRGVGQHLRAAGPDGVRPPGTVGGVPGRLAAGLGSRRRTPVPEERAPPRPVASGGGGRDPTTSAARQALPPCPTPVDRSCRAAEAGSDRRVTPCALEPGRRRPDRRRGSWWSRRPSTRGTAVGTAGRRGWARKRHRDGRSSS